MGTTYTLTPITLDVARTLIESDNPDQSDSIAYPAPSSPRIWSFGNHSSFDRMVFFLQCEVAGPAVPLSLSKTQPGLYSGLDLGHHGVHLLMPVHVAALSDRLEAMPRAAILACLNAPELARERENLFIFSDGDASEEAYYIEWIDDFRLFLREVRAQGSAVMITAG